MNRAKLRPGEGDVVLHYAEVGTLAEGHKALAVQALLEGRHEHHDLHEARAAEGDGTMKGRQQPKMPCRNPTEFRAGVKALAEEVQSVIKIVTITPEDFVIMLGEVVAGHSDNLDLLETVADLVARVGHAPKSAPMLCWPW